jgi:hypothetical protein
MPLNKLNKEVLQIARLKNGTKWHNRMHCIPLIPPSDGPDVLNSSSRTNKSSKQQQQQLTYVNDDVYAIPNSNSHSLNSYMHVVNSKFTAISICAIVKYTFLKCIPFPVSQFRAMYFQINFCFVHVLLDLNIQFLNL